MLVLPEQVPDVIARAIAAVCEATESKTEKRGENR
jgi:hypothetical protein